MQMTRLHSTTIFSDNSPRRPILSNLLRVDAYILSLIILLCAISLGVQYSASGQELGPLLRQFARICVALAMMVVIASIPTDRLCKYAPHLYFLGFVLLVLVLAIGFVGRGAQRWLDLGVIRFQPAEFMKIAVPMLIAWILTRPPLFSRNMNFLICGILLVMPVFLVYLQPDLGTALLIAAVGFYAIMVGGLSWRWIASIGALGVALIPIMWPFLHEYQRLRVITMFDPWQDPFGRGYHSIQSMIAIGSGGVYGKGWLNGSQSQLEFIPERSTDFIFSVYAEEFGLLGGLFLILIFVLLIGRCLLVAYQSKNEFGRIMAATVGVMIFVHLFVNVGMVAGILPVVGVPLPVMSYGGTSMVTMLAGLGIVMGVRHAHR